MPDHIGASDELGSRKDRPHMKECEIVPDQEFLWKFF